MSAGSVDNEYEWRTVAHERPSSLEIVLLKERTCYPEPGLFMLRAARTKRGSFSPRADRLEAVSGRVIRDSSSRNPVDTARPQ